MPRPAAAHYRRRGLFYTNELLTVREAGIRRIALSLDAPVPQIHDSFRQVKGSWQRTMDILHRAQTIGLSVQVNTTVAKHNVDILDEMIPFLQEVGAVQWSLFFLVPTGRGKPEDIATPDEFADVHNLRRWLKINGMTMQEGTSADMYSPAVAVFRGQMATFLTRALERAGHSVVDCENGDDAIDALDQGPWDLLLTDIVMPGADGIEVARVAAARQPGIRIMFITGFAAVALSAAQASPQAKVLAKPVHLRDLVGEVERMVAA